MSYTTWQIDVTPYENNTWDVNDKYTLGNPRDILLNVNLGEAKDSFSFNSTNFNGQNNAKLNPNDKVEIYRATNTDTIGTSDLLMIGTIKDSPDQVSYNKDTTKVEGNNYSEAIAKAIVFVDPRGKTIPEALQLALSKAGNDSSFNVEWDSSNPTTKRLGGSFPLVQEQWKNWTLKKILEQYSSAKYTEDGAYIWYIDLNNKLKWFSVKDNTKFSESIFTYTTDEVLDIKTAKDIKDVKNYIIIKGGRAPDNKGIQQKIQDYASSNKHGKKYLFYISKANNADDLINADTGSKTDRFPETYPFSSTAWTYYINGDLTSTQVVGTVVCTDGVAPTVANDDEYNDVLRQHVKNSIKAEGNEILDFYKYGKFKMDLTFRAGKKNWQLGDLIDCTVPQAFTGNKILRVTEIRYSTTTDTFSLVEDEGTL